MSKTRYFETRRRGLIVASLVSALSMAAALGGCTSDTTTSTSTDPGAGQPSPSPAPADQAPPTVSLTAPAAGDVSGTVMVSANAMDNVGVVGVQFRLNGTTLGSEDTTAPYSVNWNTATLTPGTSHTLTAVARDAAGLATTSASVIVTVRASVAGNAILSWAAPTTNEDGSSVSLSGFNIYQGTSGSNLQPIATVSAATLTYTASNLPVGTYYFAVTAVGANGMESVYSSVASKTIP